MDRNQARQIIKENWEQLLQDITPVAKMRVNGHKSYICPFCGHGSHGDGIAVNPRGNNYSLHCFGCDFSGDIIKIYQEKYETDFNSAFAMLADKLGLSVDKMSSKDFGSTVDRKKKNENPLDTIDDFEPEETTDFTAEIEAAHKALLESPEAIAHITRRGISLNMIRAYRIGYDPEGYNHILQDHPEHYTKSRKAGLYKYIFPYPANDGRYTYFMCEIADRSAVDDYNRKYRKISAGDTGLKAQIFNERYIGSPLPVVFICEGIYDALSVEEVGGKAIAFSGTAHRRFLSLCKKYRPDTCFVISLDNDSAGQRAIERVKQGLEILHIPYLVKTAQNGKDFSDELMVGREQFGCFIWETVKEAIGLIGDREKNGGTQ